MTTARGDGDMEVVVRSLAGPADAEAFRALNEEWIAARFALEEQDRLELGNPVAAYVDPGGDVLVAEIDGAVGGCIAIRPHGTAFEVSKMAVAPALRGRGAGRRLLEAAIARARELGATSLFLGSSTKLADAVHLYEALGFEHVPRESLHLPYERASVWMRLELVPAA